jgi:hypothetical protein
MVIMLYPTCISQLEGLRWFEMSHGLSHEIFNNGWKAMVVSWKAMSFVVINGLAPSVIRIIF